MPQFVLVLDEIAEHPFAQINEIVDRSAGALVYLPQGRTNYPVMTQPTSNSGQPSVYHSVRIEWDSPAGTAAAASVLALFAPPAAATARA